MNLADTIKSIKPVNPLWSAKAGSYLDSLAMPEGALGDLHNLIQRLCSVYSTLEPQIEKRTLVMSAADHGVMAQAVSKYPQITGAIVKTALNDGAAINAFCKTANCDLKIVDAGIKEDLSAYDGLIKYSMGNGSGDISLGPAMSESVCQQAVENGILLALELSEDYDLLALGEMGIGNTTVATAVICAITGWKPKDIAGPGTGVTGDALQHKIKIIERALTVNQPDSLDARDILAKVGGFEIAFMTGLILGFSSKRKAIVLDGFITSASALLATMLSPECRDYLFAGHQSAEPAHERVLSRLGIDAIVKLNLRLGEGTGAALALHTLDTACSILKGMMTLDKALDL